VTVTILEIKEEETKKSFLLREQNDADILLFRLKFCLEKASRIRADKRKKEEKGACSLTHI